MYYLHYELMTMIIMIMIIIIIIIVIIIEVVIDHCYDLSPTHLQTPYKKVWRLNTTR